MKVKMRAKRKPRVPYGLLQLHMCGVEVWRGGLDGACLLPTLSSVGASAMLPFPHPAHRTGRADLPHPALGEDSRNRRSHGM
jgi:hypothetical protein